MTSLVEIYRRFPTREAAASDQRCNRLFVGCGTQVLAIGRGVKFLSLRQADPAALKHQRGRT